MSSSRRRFDKDAVAFPVAVRDGWDGVFIPSIFNKEGLPASPLRTDDFDL
jgi:hypothetical protein